jgi:FkbM family methyltransferase
MNYSGVTSKGLHIDSILDDLMGGKRGGYFIELGANDGLTQSNSAFFEFSRGWTGVLIEPSHVAYEKCVAARPGSKCVNAACVTADYAGGDTVVGDFDGGLMSSVESRRIGSSVRLEAPARTLESILDEAGAPLEPDLLSIDTEGYELNVLRGMNIRKYRPLLVIIEIYTADYDSICQFMRESGYMLHSNITGYNPVDNPGWDGTHNDYLFVRG